MKEFPVSILNTEETSITSERILPVVQEMSNNDDVMKESAELMAKSSTALTNSLRQGKKSEYTKQIIEADNRRDNGHDGFKGIIETSTHHPDPEIVDSAYLLYDIVQVRGLSLTHLGFGAQTAQMKLLLADLETPKAQALIEKIGGKIWYDQMKSTQEDFEKLYQEKVDTESKKEIPLQTECRKKLKRYLGKILEHLDLKEEINPSYYLPFIKRIEEILTDTITIARARITREKNEKLNATNNPENK